MFVIAFLISRSITKECTGSVVSVADEIRRGRCNVQTLKIFRAIRSGATEAVKEVASAIRLDRNLTDLTLIIENGFTDEAGVALAEALTVNKTLRTIRLASTMNAIRYARNRTTLGAQSYEAFDAMLRVNTSLVLELPPLDRALRHGEGFLSLLVRCILSSD